ncbi:MAG: hypothetical protein LCH95_14460 [Proteobacteria bacterium]|nr:hypothetical protein [Pseudomonadota bacterium]
MSGRSVHPVALLSLAVAALLATILPAAAQQCVPYFQEMKSRLQRAGTPHYLECARRNNLMLSIGGDMVDLPTYAPGSPGAPTNIPGIARQSLASLEADMADWKQYGVIVSNRPDPRWTVSGSRITFNCSAPLATGQLTQSEAFVECARLYMCATATIDCALDLAGQGGSNCPAMSGACLARNPIPAATAPPAGQAGRGATGPGQDAGRQAPPPASQQPALDPRQQVFRSMSPQCQADFEAFLAASQSNDGPGAAAAYGRLRSQCDQAMRELARLNGVTLPERPLPSRSADALAKAFGQDPSAATSQIYQPTEVAKSPSFYGPMLEFGAMMFGTGAALAGGWAAVAAGGGNFTTLNPRASSTHGQGAPLRPAPRNRPSDITGTK